MSVLVDIPRGMGREVCRWDASETAPETRAIPATLRQAYTGTGALDAASIQCTQYQSTAQARTVAVPAHVACIVRQLMGLSAPATDDDSGTMVPPSPAIRREGAHLTNTSAHKVCMGHSYGWMMQHDLPERRKDTWIAYGPNPFISTAVHHHGLVYNKDTRIALQNWRVGFILGPFGSPHEASRCCHEWVDHTRGKKSKTTRGIYLAQRHGVPFYWDKIQPPRGVLPYLRDHGPAPMKRAITDYLVYPTSSEETYDSDGGDIDDSRELDK